MPSFGILLVSFVQLYACWFLFYIILFNRVTFCFYFLEAYSFPIRDKKGLDLDGKESGEHLGGVNGREFVFRLYYMRKEYMFNMRENKSFLSAKCNLPVSVMSALCFG